MFSSVKTAASWCVTSRIISRILLLIIQYISRVLSWALIIYISHCNVYHIHLALWCISYTSCAFSCASYISRGFSCLSHCIYLVHYLGHHIYLALSCISYTSRIVVYIIYISRIMLRSYISRAFPTGKQAYHSVLPHPSKVCLLEKKTFLIFFSFFFLLFFFLSCFSFRGFPLFFLSFFKLFILSLLFFFFANIARITWLWLIRE